MSTEIATQEEPRALDLPSATQGAEMIERLQWASQTLADAVIKNGWAASVGSGEKRYLEVEAWQFIGMVMGIDADIEYTKAITNDAGIVLAYESKAVLYRNGAPFSAGIMECGMDSFPTRSRNGREKDKAAQSASQTWAISKAYRNKLGYLAKMAGYEATPADEMRQFFVEHQPQASAPVATPPPPPRPQAPVPPPQPSAGIPVLAPCSIHNVEWDVRPTPASWNKTPEGRPFNTASHRLEGGSGYCNFKEVYKQELAAVLGPDRDVNDACREWLGTTWSYLDPEQMVEVVRLERQRFGGDSVVGINIIDNNESPSNGLPVLFDENGEELPEEDQPF